MGPAGSAFLLSLPLGEPLGGGGWHGRGEAEVFGSTSYHKE